MVEKTLLITGANHDYHGAPVSVQLDAPAKFGSIKLVDCTTKHSVPCQWEKTQQGVLLSWMEYALEGGATKAYQAIFSEGVEDQRSSNGVELKETGEGRLDVLLRGEFFTSYYFGPQWHRPYFHPVIGPYGDSVTRAYPMVEGAPGETTDHLHHRGIWVGHGAVNSVDNWSEGESKGFTLHREFALMKGGPVYGHVIALSEWVSPDKQQVLFKETREMKFYNTSPSRLVDIDLTFTAQEEDVLFGDDKEVGIIALRVASSMDVPRGGRIENSFGAINTQEEFTDREVWGKRAHWCDFSGPVNSKVVGIAIFDHNKSFRHPTYWHARGYGLVTANPFGISGFEGPGYNGDYNLPAGDSLNFRYRIYIHKGDATEGKVAEKYNNYVSPPTVQVG